MSCLHRSHCIALDGDTVGGGQLCGLAIGIGYANCKTVGEFSRRQGQIYRGGDFKIQDHWIGGAKIVDFGWIHLKVLIGLHCQAGRTVRIETNVAGSAKGNRS